MFFRPLPTLNAVAENFRISQPAVSKHMRILTECGLVVIVKRGRERHCSARLETLQEVAQWAEQYRQFWARGDMELVEGGKVLRVEAPRLLAFTWEGGSEVTFELEKDRDLVRLTVTHRKLTPEQYSAAPGWHTHLDILDRRLQEKTPENFWKTFLQWEEVYQKRMREHL